MPRKLPTIYLLYIRMNLFTVYIMSCVLFICSNLDGYCEKCNQLFSFSQTSYTLSWVLYSLARNSEVQEKLRDEIHRVVGSDRIVTPAHINQMSYLRNTLRETQRYAQCLTLTTVQSEARMVTPTLGCTQWLCSISESCKMMLCCLDTLSRKE